MVSATPEETVESLPPPCIDREGTILRVCNRAPRWRSAAIAVGAAVSMTAIGRLASFAPESVDRYYANGIGATFARAMSFATGMAPFSLVEPLLLLFVCWLAWPVALAAYNVARGRRTAFNALACGATRIARTAGILVTAFYVLWGFNYSRAALPERLGWNDESLAALPRLGTPDDRDELIALCTQLVFVTNHYYAVATGAPDAEEHSVPRVTDAELDRSIEQGYACVTRLLHLDASVASTHGPAKAIFASRAMSELGIAGFYSPWTGEANYNREMPPFQRPLTIAHEKAHQRCVASEDEANFLGFAACVLSDDPYARYSGYLFAQRQLLNELLEIDPVAARAIIALRCKGVQSDVNYSKLFWRFFRGPAQTFSHALNDVYLKANRVDGGMMSYQMSARLLVLFARHNDGSCVVDAAALESDTGTKGTQEIAKESLRTGVAS